MRIAPSISTLNSRLRAPLPDRRGAAFTLVELLVVMLIMIVLLGLLIPAFNSNRDASEVTKASYEIAGIFEQARAYAMANNTYVFVGVAEVDAAISDSMSPQTTATATAGGRVALAVVASKDGTKHYADATSGQGLDWQANYADSTKAEYLGGHLVAVGKLQRYENLHLASSLPPPVSGSMYRPTLLSTYVLGNSACKSQTPFTWPLGKQLSSGYQYRFDKVVQFDPQGVARITYLTNSDTIVTYMEVSLQPTHSNAVPPPPLTPGLGNQAAIQLDAMTGSTRIYRP